MYAHWTRSTSLVTYKDWNGTILKTEEVAVEGNATPPTDPTRTGYTFLGWDKPSTNIQDHTIITAQYTINGHKLTLDGNGGTLEGSDVKELGFQYGETYDQALADGRDSVTLTYHTFEGWYTSPIGGTKYSYTGNVMPNSDVTVYAHWTRSASLVTYKDWNGTILKTQEVTIGGNATPPADPTRPGYTFLGWDKPSTNIQDHTVITAQYTINSYKLTLDGNGGSMDGSLVKEWTVTYNELFDQILTDGKNEASQPGYTFDGWYTSKTGGNKYTYSGNRMPASDITVYAQWKVKQCVIHFDKNLNAVGKNPEDKIVAYGEPVGTLPVINAEGYTFLGWYTEPNNGTKVIETTPAPLGETTYYAHWDKKSEPTEPEPSKPDPPDESEKNKEEKETVVKPVDPVIDSNSKPTVPDTGGNFTVNPYDPRDVTYTKPDGTPAKDEWVGDGEDWYHVDANGKLNYDWFLEGEKTWYKLNKEPGDKFGAALIGWNHEPMDKKRYFFDPGTTKMLTGWQFIDNKWYYFTKKNEAQTYFGSNHDGWLYDPAKPGKPYGSMYWNEKTPDGYLVDENGVWKK
ncbi:MAG: InlB B-repeat-containing protein [Hungatella sp.]|nr:InlB B-repeat-containing protein [Hungatella sp.]